MRIAIIGAGVSGLVAARLLHERHDTVHVDIVVLGCPPVQ
jgi:protoporphyrinogen oxidase